MRILALTIIIFNAASSELGRQIRNTSPPGRPASSYSCGRPVTTTTATCHARAFLGSPYCSARDFTCKIIICIYIYIRTRHTQSALLSGAKNILYYDTISYESRPNVYSLSRDKTSANAISFVLEATYTVNIYIPIYTHTHIYTRTHDDDEVQR